MLTLPSAKYSAVPVCIAPGEIVAEPIVVADEAGRLAPVAGGDRQPVDADDIEHRGLGAGDQPFELAVQHIGRRGAFLRQGIMHLLVLRQKQRQRARAFQHGAQQRDLQIGIGAPLRRQRPDLGGAAVEAGAVERRRDDHKRDRRKQQPGTARPPAELLGRRRQGSGRALQHRLFVHDFAQSTIRLMRIVARSARETASRRIEISQ